MISPGQRVSWSVPNIRSVTIFLVAAFLIATGLPAQQKPIARSITFLTKVYRLASFNQKSNPMWEFTSANETVKNWTTLLTITDRPDARTRPDLGRLSQGILDNYKSHGAQILMAKTMVDASKAPYDYTVAAFEDPADHRFELNLVKAALGPKNAYMAIYGVRITDPKDYVSKAKTYLTQHSDEVGRELEKAALPAIGPLPRKEF